MHLRTTVPTVLLLVTGLCAQAKYAVSPAYFATTFAKDGASVFMGDAPCTHMQIHRDLGATAMMIKEISFRRYFYVMDSPAFTASISLAMSMAAPAAPTPVYSANHSTNKTAIYRPASPKTFSFPKTSYSSTPKFEYHIPFPTATAHLHVPTTSLCWEMRVHSSTAGSFTWIDRVNAAKSVKATPVGKGCTGQGLSSAPALQSSIVEEPAKNRFLLSTMAASLPRSQSYLLWFGLSKKLWGTTPLPLDLSPIGGPGCAINTEPIVSLGGTTSSAGFITSYYPPLGTGIPCPNTPSFQGLPFYMQYWCADPTRKSGLKAIFSEGQELVIPGSSALAKIYTKKNASATSGTVVSGTGLVTRFTY
jgi:hypothetical protein